MTASASSAACRLASATVRSILARSVVIMSWAFRSASDTAFCSSVIAWRFTSLTASSACRPHGTREHFPVSTGPWIRIAAKQNSTVGAWLSSRILGSSRGCLRSQPILEIHLGKQSVEFFFFFTFNLQVWEYFLNYYSTTFLPN